MSNNLKVIVHGFAMAICGSVQRGLPFVEDGYMADVLKGILAKAQEKYPVKICQLVFMGSHFHLLLVVLAPDDVPRFMDYVKTEIAHALNRQNGTEGESFWIRGYDSPSILDADTYLQRMLYDFLNPVRAGLVRTVSNYHGLNTFQALLKGGLVERCKKVSRRAFRKLPERELTVLEKELLRRELREAPGTMHELRIEPWAWLRCFEESKDWKPQEVLKLFLEMLKVGEEELAKQHPRLRPKASWKFRRSFRSKRDGKKMLCLASTKERRQTFLSWALEGIALAKDAYRQRRMGKLSAVPPPGFFLPGGALLACFLPCMVPN